MERLDDKTLKALGPELQERLANARMRGDRRLVKFLDGIRTALREVVEKRAEEAASRTMDARLEAIRAAENAASNAATVRAFNGDD